MRWRRLILICIVVSKGISGNLMKASSQRRRTKQQIREAKAEEEKKQAATAAKLAQYDVLQGKVQKMEASLGQAGVM